MILLMITLEKQFVSGAGGFATEPRTYTQLMRTETVAMYSRSLNGVIKDYEVFKIKILPKGTRIFKLITEDDEEKYPGSSQFGRIAWSFNQYQAALHCYNSLCKNGTNGISDVTVEDTDSDLDVDGETVIESKPVVAKVKKDLIVPVSEFTVGEMAEQNSVNYVTAFLWVKSSVATGSVKFVRDERRNAKGNPSKIYAKTS